MTQNYTLTIQLTPHDAELLQMVARFRQRKWDGQGQVDLGAYLRELIQREITACIQEIQARRR